MFSSQAAVKAILMRRSGRSAKTTSPVFRVTCRVNPADLDRLYATARERESQKGRIDILLANPGIWEFAPMSKSPKPTLTKNSSSTSKGFCSVSKMPFPCFRSAEGFGSLSASVASSMGLETLTVYSTSRAAVRSFARTWTVGLKKHRIRADAVSPPTDRPTDPSPLP